MIHMLSAAAWLVVGLLTLTPLQMVAGHGILLDPPQRSSVWRDMVTAWTSWQVRRFPQAPVNTLDTQLFCGGFNVQYSQLNAGRCGVCGDAYSDPHPRANEAGGTYGRGIIVRTYTQADVIDVTVKITANHLGYFVFKLCPSNNVGKEVTQTCLDQRQLQVLGKDYGEETASDRFVVSDYSLYGDIHIKVKLPRDVTCTQCVLQWTYRAGNSWGSDQFGSGLGHGNQENFVNCADVAILPSQYQQSIQPGNNRPSWTNQPSGWNTAEPPKKLAQFYWTPATTTTTTTSTTTTTPRGQTGICRSFGAYDDDKKVDAWCKVNCAVGYCPVTHCTCV